MEDELIPCEYPFSNGTEYEIFLESQCDHCTLFRKGRCKTYRLIEEARWDIKVFPFDQLMDYARYGGKVCIRFTTEKRFHKKRAPRQIAGQMKMEGL